MRGAWEPVMQGGEASQISGVVTRCGQPRRSIQGHIEGDGSGGGCARTKVGGEAQAKRCA